MTEPKNDLAAIKALEDAIRGALGVFPKSLPLSVHKNDRGPSGPNVTSPFGPRNLEGKESFHRGTDIGLVEGSPIYALYNGKVTYSGWEDVNDQLAGGGIYVKISHDGGLDSFYMHLSKPMVNSGDVVRAGDVVGYSGATGNATRNGKKHPHLHLEVRQNGSPRSATSQEVAFVQSGGRRESGNA